LKGTHTIHQIEGYDEIESVRIQQEMQKDEASAKSTPESFGLFRHKREYKERKTRITI